MAPEAQRGFRRDGHGWRVYVKVGTIQRERRFPPDTSVKTMRAWRDETRVALRRIVPRPLPLGTLSHDITRYLLLVRSMPTFEERARHLTLWAAALGETTPRTAITSEQITRVLQDWHAQGLGAHALNKRRTALMHLYSTLDGKSAANPLRDVPKFRVPDPLPRGRDLRTLRQGIDALPASKTRTRLQLLLWTGIRPVELMRAQPDDVDDARRLMIVRTAKGGRTRTVPLAAPALQAWRTFRRLEAWGRFTLAPMNRILQRACPQIPDLKVYDLRHSYATALIQQQVPVTIVASLLGHSTLDLTRRYTLAAVAPESMVAITRLARMAGRKVVK